MREVGGSETCGVPEHQDHPPELRAGLIDQWGGGHRGVGGQRGRDLDELDALGLLEDVVGDAAHVAARSGQCLVEVLGHQQFVEVGALVEVVRNSLGHGLVGHHDAVRTDDPAGVETGVVSEGQLLGTRRRCVDTRELLLDPGGDLRPHGVPGQDLVARGADFGQLRLAARRPRARAPGRSGPPTRPGCRRPRRRR
jgi:hypothetical protein